MKVRCYYSQREEDKKILSFKKGNADNNTDSVIKLYPSAAHFQPNQMLAGKMIS